MSHPRAIVTNSLILLVGLIVALGAVEIFLRFYEPRGIFETGKSVDWGDESSKDLQKLFAPDDALGYRPRLDNNYYNQYGTRTNYYPLEKRPQVRRLLFIGDSVTARGKIIDGLKANYGEDRFEYWNAGVEGYNTIQQLGFYKSYNSMIKPDVVILTFHNNDFRTTPVLFLDENNEIFAIFPNRPQRHFNLWMFRHSYLYRFLAGLTFLQAEDEEAIEAEVTQAVQELNDILIGEVIEFKVIVFPALKPYQEWSSHEKESRAQIFELLEALGIEYFDLLEVSDKAIAQGVNVHETPGDVWHPSAEISQIFADYLYTQGIFSQE
jgi:hypothetical protein